MAKKRLRRCLAKLFLFILITTACKPSAATPRRFVGLHDVYAEDNAYDNNNINNNDNDDDDQMRQLETIVHKRGGCMCPCKRLGSDRWDCCECTYTDSACFPATATVTLETGQTLTMRELEVGQTIMTVSDTGDLVWTKVTAHMQRTPDIRVRYIRLTTTSGQQLLLSRTHLVYVSRQNNTDTMATRYAYQVEVGDYVRVVQHNDIIFSIVTEISMQVIEGAYAPLTEHGTLVVDGVLASCYASFDHDVAHAAMAPLRWVPQLFDVLPVSRDGVHAYVQLTKWLGRSLLPVTWFTKSKTADSLYDKSMVMETVYS